MQRYRQSKPTRKEIVTLQLIADHGLDANDIAARMDCSMNNVHKTLMRLRSKLRANSTAHAVAIGFRQGLLK